MALEGMNVKIGADISGLIEATDKAIEAFSDVAKSVDTLLIPSLSKGSASADILEASLSSMADAGKAKIAAMADKALGISPLLTNLSKNVAAFGGGVTTNKLPDYFKKVSDEAVKTSNTLGSTIPGSSDRAANALMNLGRIAQDAPFGFIGISNNINPMLESFQRLQKETGSTSGALKAMASGLLGGGGLGLAVSVATSLLTVLAMQGFFKTEQAADEAGKKIKAFKDAVANIFENEAKEVSEVKGLVAVLESESATRERKLATIKELQKINPEMFGSLKMEGNLVTGLDAAYKAYIENVRTVIAVKVIQKKLEDSISESLKFQGATETSDVQKAAKYLQDMNNSRRQQVGYVKTLGDLKYDKAVAEENKRLAEQKDLQEQLVKLQAGVKVPTVDFKEDNAEKAKAHIRDVDDVLKALNSDLAFNQKLADIGFISSSEQDLQKIAKVKSAIEEIIKLKKGKALSVDSPIISNLITSIQPEEVRQQLAERSKEIVKTLKTVSQTDLYKASDAIPFKVPIDIKPSANTDRALEKTDEELKEAFKKLALNIQKNVLDSGLASVGEMIGAAIGGGDVAGAFRGLLNTIIAGMRQLGEAMIGLGTAKAQLEKFGITPGIGTVLAGVGIVALSSLIQSALPKFADGVSGFGGGMALVGERGPELVRLPQGSDVIPNHRINQISSQVPQVVVLTPRIQGSDLLLVHDRALQQRGRRS